MNIARLFAAFLLLAAPLTMAAGQRDRIEREELTVSYNDSSDTSSEDMKSGVFQLTSIYGTRRIKSV